MRKNSAKRIAAYCEQVIDLEGIHLGKQYYFHSLPLCVITTVYSISIRYESVQKVVDRYCTYFQLPRLRPKQHTFPCQTDQESIPAFVQKMTEYGIDRFTQEIFTNRNRTSTVNGILKAEAVFRFAEVLHKYEIHYFQDVPKVIANPGFERDVRLIPGQKSGISHDYFLMLTGSEDFIKPDRMVLRFLSQVLGQPVTIPQAQTLIREASAILRPQYPQASPRLLDYAIWNYQRSQVVRSGRLTTVR
jgi:hypothetical protein